MHRARSAYGALIRAPVIGPFIRLPLRLLRWLIQAPDLDPSSRADRLEMQVQGLQAQLDALGLAHERLRRDQEHGRLILLMLSGRLAPTIEQDLLPRLDEVKSQRYAAE